MIFRILCIIVISLLSIQSTTTYADQSSDTAKMILEKTLDKYDGLFSKNHNGIESISSKLLIKGGRNINMGNSGNMTVDLDLSVDLYAEQPNKFFLDISGNLGKAQVFLEREDFNLATIILPTIKQFTIINVPERIGKRYHNLQSIEGRENIMKNSTLEYNGTQNFKAGKVHKITIKQASPSGQSSTVFYILDKKWDPIRIELADPQGMVVTIDIEKLNSKTKIPKEKFIPNTNGYTQIAPQQLTSAIMMQIMASGIGGVQKRQN